MCGSWGSRSKFACKSAGISRGCTIEELLYISVSGAVWASHIWISPHCANRAQHRLFPPPVLLMWLDSRNTTTATCQLHNKEVFNGMTTFVSTNELDNNMHFLLALNVKAKQEKKRSWIEHNTLSCHPVLLLNCPHSETPHSDINVFCKRPLHNHLNITSQYMLYRQAKFSLFKINK